MANGLVFITSTSFTTQASVSIDNCFSATYTHYLVKRNFLGSNADVGVVLRMRTGGVTDTGNNYRYQYLNAISTTPGAARVTGTSFIQDAFGYTETTSFGYSELWISNPFEAVRTTCWADLGADQDGSIVLESVVGAHDTAASQDGFTAILNGAGTITGSISVWGLVKA